MRVILSYIATLTIPVMLISCSAVSTVKRNICPVDVKILQYHVQKHYETIKTLGYRLYAKNPKYSPDINSRKRKIDAIFSGNNFSYPYPGLSKLLSHEILIMAFSPRPIIEDRVFLLILGLKKAVDEAYGIEGLMLTGCQIDAKRLARLYNNIAQANWRMKTYRDEKGQLYFLTNARDENGGLNMGFEVLMTQMLTRIEDDMYLRKGLEGNLAIRLSSVFLSIL